MKNEKVPDILEVSDLEIAIKIISAYITLLDPENTRIYSANICILLEVLLIIAKDW